MAVPGRKHGNKEPPAGFQPTTLRMRSESSTFPSSNDSGLDVLPPPRTGTMPAIFRTLGRTTISFSDAPKDERTSFPLRNDAKFAKRFRVARCVVRRQNEKNPSRFFRSPRSVPVSSPREQKVYIPKNASFSRPENQRVRSLTPSLVVSPSAPSFRFRRMVGCSFADFAARLRRIGS